jgi:purine catabolism regulator
MDRGVREMNSHSKLNVAEVLQRRHFQKAEVIAGKKGLLRTVKWVHVMEVTEIRTLLSGNELILSTGVAWKENNEVFLSFLQQLVDRNASGLCIELGTYMDDIPQVVIELAEKNDFPLIVFHTEVRFIDITQDLHSFMIEQHYQMISNLENYSHKLNQLLLSTDGHKKILQLCQKTLNTQLVYIMNENEIQFIPKISEEKQKKIICMIQDESKYDHFTIARQQVKALEHQFAELIVILDLEDYTNYESLVLDRSATALAQHHLRELYVEEKGRAEEIEWIQGWLDGEYDEEEILQYIFDHDPHIKPNGCAVCFFKINHLNRDYLYSELTYLKGIFRSVFKRQGFYLLPIIKRNRAIFILVNIRDNTNWKGRIKQGIDLFKNTDYAKKLKLTSVSYGVGKFTTRLSELNKSYQTAKEVIKIREKLGINKEGTSYFYNDLHIYRLISIIHKHSDLKEFVFEYLQPVISYDQKTNGKLMNTLKTYLACNGSKKETARELFIVRQSLYARIKKLNELLGEDFMESEKRRAIEFALSAYEYFYS